MAAKRDANWGFMAKVAAAAMVAEMALMGFFWSSLCVDGPCHMLLAPIEGKFSDFLPFLALPRLGQFLLPRLIFLLFPFVIRVHRVLLS